MDRFRRRLEAMLTTRVRAVLEQRRVDSVAEVLAETRVRATRLAARVEADLARLDPTPCSGAMTVHAAHARHPGVRALFARRGLPSCPDCAVGADETLAEAAFGEGFDLGALLDELHALTDGGR